MNAATVVIVGGLLAFGLAGVDTDTTGPPGTGGGSVWDRVAQCEASGDWQVNTGNGYYGGLQFLGSTWDEYGGHEFAPRADLASRQQQIAVAERVLAVQGPGAWPACSYEGGLR